MNIKILVLISGLVLAAGVARSAIITGQSNTNLDLNSDGIKDFFGTAGGSYLDEFGHTRSFPPLIDAGVGTTVYLICLETNGAFMDQNAGPYLYNLVVDAPKYAGLRLIHGGTTNYGWAYVQVVGSRPPYTHISFTYAYQTIPGRGIYVGATNEPVIKIAQLGNSQIQLSWPFGALQSASSPKGPFADVLSATSPFVVNMTNGCAFYRLRLGTLP